MATIAKSSITLVSISDAYSVSLQPSNITINADPYGKNPQLANAYTIISLYCGDGQVPIASGKVTDSSLRKDGVWKTDCVLEKVGDSLKLSITSVGDDIDGWREIEVFTKAGQRLTARFAYTIVRETALLDWIIEWDKEYTQITGESVATPNAFIGSCDDEGYLSGVYIGGNMPGHPAGIYAVKGCDQTAFVQGNISQSEIFHLNEYGGMIGGWNILKTGIFTSNLTGSLQILSEGTIQYVDLNDIASPFWSFRKDGSGTLAHGNISWDTLGNASFDGEITASSGKIGGWSIGEHSLYLGSILLDSGSSLIGIRNASVIASLGEPTQAAFLNNLKTYGGVFMHYTSGSDYGLEGWVRSGTLQNPEGRKVFSLGSTNIIAGWRFDYDSIYLGAKCNTAGVYASSVNGGVLTLGSEGLRGVSWYIDGDGTVDFVDGRLHFDTGGGSIAGWNINPSELASAHTVLLSGNAKSGLFVSNGTLANVGQVPYEEAIKSTGGIALYATDSIARLSGYVKGSKLAFQLDSEGDNVIGGWKFSDKAFYHGALTDTAGTFTGADGEITFGAKGLRGFKWRFDSDGAGALAGGNLSWTGDGEITVASDALYVTSKDGTRVTLITGNKINTELIEVNKLTAKTNDVLKSTWNEDDDGSVKMYYPDGSVCLRVGHMIVDNQDTVLQCFDADGNVTWYLSLFGGQTPSNTTAPYSWSALSLVPVGKYTYQELKSNQVLEGNIYYQFHYNSGHQNANPIYEPYDGMVYIGKGVDMENTANIIPDGTYYSEMKYPGLFNTSTNQQEASYRWRYKYEGGLLVSQEKYEL